MDIKVKYRNGTAPFEVSTVEKGVVNTGEPIIAIDVEGTSGKSRSRSLFEFIRNIEFSLRDILYLGENEIESMEISGNFMGNYLKMKSATLLDAYQSDKSSQSLEHQLIDKYPVVFYEFFSDSFSDKRVLDGVDKLGDEKYKSNDKNLVIDNRINKTPSKRKNIANTSSDTPNKDRIVHSYDIDSNSDIVTCHELLSNSEYIKKIISYLSVALKQYIPYYDIGLRSVDGGEKKLSYSYNHSPLNSIEDVRDDDVFIFFKFVEYIVHEEKHLGVFFIDTSMFRLPVLTILIGLIRLVYRNNALIFLHTLTPSIKNHKDMRFSYETITIPNHKLNTKPIENNNKLENNDNSKNSNKSKK